MLVPQPSIPLFLSSDMLYACDVNYISNYQGKVVIYLLVIVRSFRVFFPCLLFMIVNGVIGIKVVRLLYSSRNYANRHICLFYTHACVLEIMLDDCNSY